jgi:PKD repeat protein
MKRPRVLSLFLIIAAILVLVIAACDKLVTERIENTLTGYPKAEFTVFPDTCCRPCTLDFKDNSDGPRDQYIWSFGDGDSAFVANPTHVYNDTGNFDVELVVIDNATGNRDNEIKLNYIRILDTIPKAPSLSFFTIVPDSAALTYNFADSTKVIINSWLWNFGDNTTATNRFVQHTFDSAGTYEIRLTIENNCDSTDLFDTLVVP